MCFCVCVCSLLVPFLVRVLARPCFGYAPIVYGVHAITVAVFFVITVIVAAVFHSAIFGHFFFVCMYVFVSCTLYTVCMRDTR